MTLAGSTRELCPFCLKRLTPRKDGKLPRHGSSHRRHCPGGEKTLAGAKAMRHNMRLKRGLPNGFTPPQPEIRPEDIF